MTEYEGPCRTCGSEVRTTTVKLRGEMAVSDLTAPVVQKRICLNPKCPMNTGDRALNDVV